MWQNLLRLYWVCSLCSVVACQTGKCQAGEVELYQQAKLAYQSKNPLLLSELSDSLNQRQSPLAPYTQYWQLLLNPERLDSGMVETFVTTYPDTLMAQRVRELWLKRLGKTNTWDLFAEVRAQIPAYYVYADISSQCYLHQAAIVQDAPDAYVSAKQFVQNGKLLTPECEGLLDAMQQVGVLNEAFLLKLTRQALFDNQLAIAKFWAKRSGKVTADWFKWLDDVAQNPASVLKKADFRDKTAFGRSVMLYAIHRQARADIKLAQDNWKKIQSVFSSEDKQQMLAMIALEAARKHAPEALSSFQALDEHVLNATQWEWYARSALRQQAWAKLLKILDQMPTSLAEEACWRYWRARALKQLGQTVEANQILAHLSTERHYYGWLAAEELGPVLGEPDQYYEATEDLIKYYTHATTFKRIALLLEAEARYEARLEWQYFLEGLDDKSKIAVASIAAKKGWYDMAVTAADKTTKLHNFDLRYPTPYREYLQKAARGRDIDEAWVYGIIRQESRFMHYAKSAVGAGGLMQVMPATAKWIAKKLGWLDYHDGLLHDIDTNVTLGTYYMRYTLDTFNGQEAMATAAYNAGPSRARKWAAEGPLEGAIYTETIPYGETRNYVKKVLANAHIYAPRLGLPAVGLKKRLGIVPARDGQDSTVGSSEANNEE